MLTLPPNITINADDFGYSPAVNEAITHSFNMGIINRTTLMVNMPYHQEAIKLSEVNGFSNHVGLHLNLTEGKPISSELANCDIFTENGEFNGKIRTLVRSHLKKSLKEILTIELKSQIELFLDLGLSLKHVDSHHHVHTEWLIYNILSKLLYSNFQFSSMRLARNLESTTVLNVPKVIYKRILNKCIKHRFCTTDYFGSYNDFRSSVYNPDKEYEIMVHPVMKDGQIMDKTDGGKHLNILEYEYPQN